MSERLGLTCEHDPRERSAGRRIANPRGSEESWFERKAEKGGKRDASASRSESVGRGGGWIGRVACVTRDFGLIGLPLGRGIG